MCFVCYNLSTLLLSGDPWIHGPWFIRPADVSHTPTRVFYESELFQSNIQDTNPMRSICGRLTVTTLNDYCKSKKSFYDNFFQYMCC